VTSSEEPTVFWTGSLFSEDENEEGLMSLHAATSTVPSIFVKEDICDRIH
jgi:hypothetical protein